MFANRLRLLPTRTHQCTCLPLHGNTSIWKRRRGNQTQCAPTRLQERIHKACRRQNNATIYVAAGADHANMPARHCRSAPRHLEAARLHTNPPPNVMANISTPPCQGRSRETDCSDHQESLCWDSSSFAGAEWNVIGLAICRLPLALSLSSSHHYP